MYIYEWKFVSMLTSKRPEITLGPMFFTVQWGMPLRAAREESMAMAKRQPPASTCNTATTCTKSGMLDMEEWKLWEKKQVMIVEAMANKAQGDDGCEERHVMIEWKYLITSVIVRFFDLKRLFCFFCFGFIKKWWSVHWLSHVIIINYVVITLF